MIPVAPTAEQVAYWADLHPSEVVSIGGPQEGPDVTPCPAILTESNIEGDHNPSVPVVRVAFQMDEIELTHLAKGGTLWLSCWGGLPIHMIEVQPPSGDTS